jgi:hypothetical protein
MQELIRRRTDDHVETWEIWYGDVQVGTIAQPKFMARPHLMQTSLTTATPLPRGRAAALEQLPCLASNGILLRMKRPGGCAASYLISATVFRLAG